MAHFAIRLRDVHRKDGLDQGVDPATLRIGRIRNTSWQLTPLN